MGNVNSRALRVSPMSQDDVPESLRTAADSDRPRAFSRLPTAISCSVERRTTPTTRRSRSETGSDAGCANAMLDFSILFEYMEERDRETVFDPDAEDRDAYTQGITDMLAFLHLGTIGYHTPFKDMLFGGRRQGRTASRRLELPDGQRRVQRRTGRPDRRRRGRRQTRERGVCPTHRRGTAGVRAAC